MYQWPIEIKQRIKNILCADNPVEAFKIQLSQPNIDKIQVVCFDGDSNTEFAKINIEYSIGKFNIINLGDYNKITVLNSSVLRNTEGFQKIKFLQSLDLDSNVVSLINKQFHTSKIVNTDFFNALIYIKENNIQTNLISYILEDSLNFNGMKNVKAYSSLLSAYIFERITLEDLHDRSFNPTPNDYVQADNAWNSMCFMHNNQKEKNFRVRVIYCFLIKMYMTFFESKSSPEKKLMKLIQFVNNNLGIYLENGLLLAYWYFEQSQECVNRFFGKVQPLSKNKLKAIENTAWDLFHIWDLPTEMAVESQMYSALSLKSLATCDINFAKIAKLNPITRMAFFAGEAQVKYKYSIFSVIHDDDIKNSLICNCRKRETINKSEGLIKLTRLLEKELLQMFEK